jgi:prevent-host-death family protein
MTEVASDELRDNTADLLCRVKDGEEIIVTVRGKPVACLVPLESRRRRWLPRADLIQRLEMTRADPGLREDLWRLA